MKNKYFVDSLNNFGLQMAKLLDSELIIAMDKVNILEEIKRFVEYLDRYNFILPMDAEITINIVSGKYKGFTMVFLFVGALRHCKTIRLISADGCTCVDVDTQFTKNDVQKLYEMLGW